MKVWPPNQTQLWRRIPLFLGDYKFILLTKSSWNHKYWVYTPLPHIKLQCYSQVEPSCSPVRAACTSCKQWHERWRWHGSPCLHWCRSPWWCTGPGGDPRWLPLCLAWDGDERGDTGHVSRLITTAHRWAQNPDNTKKKNTRHIVYVLYTKINRKLLFSSLHISFLFWPLRRSVRERKERREVVYLGWWGPLWGMWFRS